MCLTDCVNPVQHLTCNSVVVLASHLQQNRSANISLATLQESWHLTCNIVVELTSHLQQSRSANISLATLQESLHLTCNKAGVLTSHLQFCNISNISLEVSWMQNISFAMIQKVTSHLQQKTSHLRRMRPLASHLHQLAKSDISYANNPSIKP